MAEFAENLPGRRADMPAKPDGSPKAASPGEALALTSALPAARGPRRAPEERAGSMLSRADPATRARWIAALQARCGNRAVQRVIAGERAAVLEAAAPAPAAPAPIAPVQRKVYLANSDDNIYRDDSNEGIDLAFVDVRQEKVGKKRPMFILYSVFTELADRVRQEWQGLESAGVGRYYTPENWAKEWIRANVKFREVQLLWEDDEGKLSPLTQSLLGEETFLFKLALVAVSGPRYWNTGGGSRLPPARGTIHANEEDLDYVLSALGISAKEFSTKFRDVKFVRLDNMPYIIQHEQLREAGANIIDFDHFFYASDVSVRRSKHSRFQAAGRHYDEQFSAVARGSPEEGSLRLSLESLTPPRGHEWDATLTSRGREEGQSQAMGNWNALGAAAFANRLYGYNLALDQNWEWLHIRGAQIGGETRGGNLVPGLFVVNSEMIPYEKLIAKWAQQAPRKMRARFSVEPLSGVFARTIVIQVSAQDHPSLGTILEDNPATVRFDPLRGTVVDKMKGRIQQALYDRKREKKQVIDIEVVIDVGS
ncbi:MAG: hypothetical protein ACRDJG_08655 [Actinomycetota bacterium]